MYILKNQRPVNVTLPLILVIPKNCLHMTTYIHLFVIIFPLPLYFWMEFLFWILKRKYLLHGKSLPMYIVLCHSLTPPAVYPSASPEI